MSVIANLHHVAHWRNMPSAQIIREYADLTSMRFADNYRIGGVPLVVPARNESDDLAATLATAAHSERPVMPIVVENGSTDDTARIAELMGACVLKLSRGSKAAATQQGTFFAMRMFGAKQILYTDADTLLPRGWAGALCDQLKSLDEDGDTGALVTGGFVWDHGGSAVVDALRTVRFQHARVRCARNQWQPMCSGANYGLSFDRQGRMLEKLSAIHPDTFIGDDLMIRDAVLAAGARACVMTSPSAMVVSRGDRMGTTASLFRSRASREGWRTESYVRQYGPDVVRESSSHSKRGPATEPAFMTIAQKP